MAVEEQAQQRPSSAAQQTWQLQWLAASHVDWKSHKFTCPSRCRLILARTWPRAQAQGRRRSWRWRRG